MSANKSSHTIKSIKVNVFHFNYHLGRAENKKCGRVLEGASLAEAPDGTRLAPKTYTPKHLVEDRQGGRTASARSRTRVLTARPSSPGTTPNITTAASACSRPTPCTSAWPSSAWPSAPACSPRPMRPTPSAFPRAVRRRPQRPPRSGSIPPSRARSRRPGPLLDEHLAMPRQVAELSNRRRWHEAAPQQPVLQALRDPHTVLLWLS